MCRKLSLQLTDTGGVTRFRRGVRFYEIFQDLMSGGEPRLSLTRRRSPPGLQEAGPWRTRTNSLEFGGWARRRWRAMSSVDVGTPLPSRGWRLQHSPDTSRCPQQFTHTPVHRRLKDPPSSRAPAGMPRACATRRTVSVFEGRADSSSEIVLGFRLAALASWSWDHPRNAR